MFHSVNTQNDAKLGLDQGPVLVLAFARTFLESRDHEGGYDVNPLEGTFDGVRSDLGWWASGSSVWKGR